MDAARYHAIERDRDLLLTGQITTEEANRRAMARAEADEITHAEHVRAHQEFLAWREECAHRILTDQGAHPWRTAAHYTHQALQRARGALSRWIPPMPRGLR